MKLLFIGSDPMEFRGLLAHATAVRDAGVGARWARWATLGANETLLVANGAGPDRAAAATDAGLKAFDAEAIVSIGFCGALSPELSIADLVSATSVETGDRSYALGFAGETACATKTGALFSGVGQTVSSASTACGRFFPSFSAPRAMGPHHFAGAIRSIPYVAQTAEEKRNLAVTGAIAVEMEAAGIAARAESHGLPLYCIRAVTDLAGETLANDFNKALRLDGQFDTILILKGSLRRPMVRLPELFRLRKRCVRAAHVLGDFFAYSRI